ncbi:WXG100 family type VII secretion target [Actinomadura keratinilytica]
MDRGADLTRLRELSKTFNRKATDLQALIKALQSATSDSTGYWKGPKADRFRDDWQEVKPTFEKWVTTLNEAASPRRPAPTTSSAPPDPRQAADAKGAAPAGAAPFACPRPGAVVRRP